MKTACMFICIFILSSFIISAPLSNVPVLLTQPDGTVIHCFASGDEFFSYAHDKNGIAIVKDNSGFYVYADCIRDELKPTGHRISSTDPFKLGINKISDECVRKLYASSPAKARQMEFETFISGYSARIGKSLSQGELNNICIFIRFADDMEFTDNIAGFDSICNSFYGNAYSLKNYYRQISLDKLNITSYFFPEDSSNIVMSFRDSLPRGYYKQYDENYNPQGYKGSDGYGRLFNMLNKMIDSVKMLIPESLNLDMNNDGFVDNICFIIKGLPEIWNSPLWPHFGGLPGNKLINGKKANTYNLQMQGRFDYSILAHELFHTLGAPDLYRYNNNGFPVGYWDIMANGTGHPLVVTKYLYGHWIDSIPLISRSGKYTLKPASKTNSAFIINSPVSDKEYFVIEFRRSKDFFEHLIYGTGLVIYRINTKVERGNSDGPPDQIYVYRYNGTVSDNGDIYVSYFSDHSIRGMNSINDTTNPSGFLTNGRPGGLNISDVKIMDDSAEFYASIAPTIVLNTYPANGQILSGFSRHKIKWNPFNIDLIKLEFSADSGYTWQTSEDSIPAGPGSYNWLVPNIKTEKCKIKLSNAADPKLSVISPTVFSIKPVVMKNLLVLNSIYLDHKALRTAVIKDYLYVASDDGLHIFNKKNPNDPVEVAVILGSHVIHCIEIEGDRAYVLWYTTGIYEQMLTIYDITDPSFPVPLGEYEHIGENITVRNKIVYMSAWDELLIIDARDPGSPKLLNSLKAHANITSVINGSYGYMSSRRGLQYFDISDPSKSVILNPEDSTENFSAMAIYDNYLYTLGLEGINVYELNDSTGRPVGRSMMPLPVNPEFRTSSQLYAADNSLFMSCETAGLLCFNISDRIHPLLSSSFSANSTTMGSSFDGQNFYVANNDEGVYIIAYPIPSVAGKDKKTVAYSFSLEQNFPNPFNSITTIKYSIQKNGKVTLKLYDILGKETATLVEEFKTAGSYSVTFSGRSLSSGVYIYTLLAGYYRASRKFLLLK